MCVPSWVKNEYQLERDTEQDEIERREIAELLEEAFHNLKTLRHSSTVALFRIQWFFFVISTFLMIFGLVQQICAIVKSFMPMPEIGTFIGSDSEDFPIRWKFGFDSIDFANVTM